MNILIVKLSAIGDVAHALVFLEAVRKGFPDAVIDWVVEEEASPILFGHPALNRIIVSPRKSWQKALKNPASQPPVLPGMLHFLNELRSSHYDMVIDLQGLFRSGVLVGLSRGKKKIGMTGSREGARLFLNERPVPVDYEQHAIERYLRVAEHIGCGDRGREGRIPFTQSDRELIDGILERRGLQDRAFVAMNPMAKWPTKLWEPDRFAALATRIREELGREVVFTGSLSDRPVIGRIMDMMPGPCLNLAGVISLKELACLYARCRLLVTTDTGPMHIAAAMKCPVVALFGPTAPWRTGPYGKGHQIIRSGADCSPCFKKRCGHMACMKGIGVEQVFAAVKRALGN